MQMVPQNRISVRIFTNVRGDEPLCHSCVAAQAELSPPPPPPPPSSSSSSITPLLIFTLSASNLRPCSNPPRPVFGALLPSSPLQYSELHPAPQRSARHVLPAPAWASQKREEKARAFGSSAVSSGAISFASARRNSPRYCRYMAELQAQKVRTRLPQPLFNLSIETAIR